MRMYQNLLEKKKKKKMRKSKMENKTRIDFKLTFSFDGEFPEEEVKNLMDKISDALHHEYSSGNGFVPDDGDVMTDGIQIKYRDLCLMDKFYDSESKGRKKDFLDFSDHD